MKHTLALSHFFTLDLSFGSQPVKPARDDLAPRFPDLWPPSAESAFIEPHNPHLPYKQLFTAAHNSHPDTMYVRTGEVYSATGVPR